ncbi:protein LYK2-like [Salvia splendens]|nr:protein LYK2-like [Salvia splendens]
MTADYVAVAAAGILLITAIAATVFFLINNMKKLRREDSIKHEADSELQRLSLSFRTATDNKVSFDGSRHSFDEPSYEANRNLLRTYSFEQLQKATQHFSSSNLISGAVHRGRLDGGDVAIRRLPRHVVSRIANQRAIDHPNLIRVYGTAEDNGSNSFLILEYASNGSVRDWIHGGLAMKNQFIASCDRFLDWNRRLKICLDVANAMRFLHDAVNLFHIGLSVGNIFLDGEFGAKIGCLGISLSVENRGEGKGCLVAAPEYERERIVSPSGDVFAFGVVVLEVVSGRAPASVGGGGSISDEIERVLASEEELRGWVDCKMGERFSIDAAVEMARLARRCVEEDAAARPGAGEIAARLLNLVEELAAEG